MSETIVQKKLAKLVQQELSNLISVEHAYTPGALLTIHLVRVTADLSLAKVYITVLPDGKLEAAVQALNDNAWAVRYSLAQRIRNKVRKIPELRFYADDSFIEADRINQLIDGLDIPPPSPEDDDADPV
ncbi:MAG: 30S ribosome-binding factor RbfA [Bacteroidetes bacterium]|nr:MAG: 30S ribosome-binding factor RbfA [Bacteroidota bacterium]